MFRPLFLVFHFGPFYEIRWDGSPAEHSLTYWRIRRSRVKKKKNALSNKQQISNNNNNRFMTRTFHFFGSIHHHHKIKSFGRLVYHTLWMNERTHHDYFQCSIFDGFMCCCCCCCWCWHFSFLFPKLNFIWNILSRFSGHRWIKMLCQNKWMQKRIKVDVVVCHCKSWNLQKKKVY